MATSAMHKVFLLTIVFIVGGAMAQLSDGTVCGIGMTCGQCVNNSKSWSDGQFHCGVEPPAPDGQVCLLGTTCSNCINAATPWTDLQYHCGTQPSTSAAAPASTSLTLPLVTGANLYQWSTTISTTTSAAPGGLSMGQWVLIVCGIGAILGCVGVLIAYFMGCFSQKKAGGKRSMKGPKKFTQQTEAEQQQQLEEIQPLVQPELPEQTQTQAPMVPQHAQYQMSPSQLMSPTYQWQPTYTQATYAQPTYMMQHPMRNMYPLQNPMQLHTQPHYMPIG